MKKTSLILSCVLVAAVSMGNASCQSAGVKPFPVKRLYVADVTNRVCVEYPIIDAEKMQVGDGRELPLAPKGPCDRMAGFSRGDFKAGQNWIRDVQLKVQAIVNQTTLF